MHIVFHLFGFDIPAYGLMISIGIILANLIAYILLKQEKRSFDDLLLYEAYIALGGFFGAKLLYLFTIFDSIEWSQLYRFQYFNDLIRGGFVFYGGLIGGFLSMIVAGRIHHLDTAYYSSKLVFLVPFCHAFGRIGCFMAGCCYGIKYTGPLHVVFPSNSYAPSGIPLFPVQIVESILLFVISLIIFILMKQLHFRYTIELYGCSYSVLRFFLEYLRYDDMRGIYFGLSTSQWISILIFLLSAFSIIIRQFFPVKNSE